MQSLDTCHHLLPQSTSTATASGVPPFTRSRSFPNARPSSSACLSQVGREEDSARRDREEALDEEGLSSMALRQLPCDPGKHSSSPPTTRGACYRHEDRWRGKHGSVSQEPSWLRILSYSRNPNCTEVEMCPRATGRWLWRPVLPSGSHFPHLLQVKAALEDASEDLPNPTSTFPGPFRYQDMW